MPVGGVGVGETQTSLLTSPLEDIDARLLDAWGGGGVEDDVTEEEVAGAPDCGNVVPFLSAAGGLTLDFDDYDM